MPRSASALQVLWCGVLLAGVPEPPADPSGQLLRLVDDLVRQRPLTVDSVARITQRTLRRVPERSNSFFSVFESGMEKKPVLSSIELRVPAKSGSKSGGLALLSIDRKQCISPEAVHRHLGRDPDRLSPSNPNDPQRSYTFEYQSGWGDRRFVFDSGSDCLILVAIDQIEGAARKQ
jgi:hypothetical protein